MTTTAVAEIPAQVTKVTIKAHADRWIPQLAPFCRPDFMPERLIAGLLQAAVNTPKLLECQPATLFLALVKCARLRLDIGESGMWLVPLSKSVKGPNGEWTKVLSCEAWIDYRGLKVLAQRAGLVRSMDEYVVYQGDQFDYSLGLHPTLTHKPVGDPAKRGAIIGAYTIVSRRGQPTSFHYLPLADIDARRASSRSWSDEALVRDKKPKGAPAWWCCKAVVRDYLGRQPKTGEEMRLALAADDETPEGVDLETGEVLNVPADETIEPCDAQEIGA